MYITVYRLCNQYTIRTRYWHVIPLDINFPLHVKFTTIIFKRRIITKSVLPRLVINGTSTTQLVTCITESTYSHKWNDEPNGEYMLSLSDPKP